MTQSDSIVVTGIGVLSPLGIGLEEFWKGLIRGDCGVKRVTHFPVDNEIYRCKIASEVPKFDPQPWIQKDDPALEGRYARLALSAAGMSLRDAGLLAHEDLLQSVDLFVGSAQETGDTLESQIESWLRNPKLPLSPNTLDRIDPHAVTQALSRNFMIGGRVESLSCSCTSGILALMLCICKIQTGRSKMGLVIGADTISPLTFMGEGLTGELAKRNDDPAHASRPFDRDQDGYVIGEGAVAFMVETRSHAQARGSRIYAEFGPMAANNDATSFKYIDEEGNQFSRCHAMVLTKVPPERIDYINVHGPSIKALDRAESKAIRKAFGSHADRIPVSSIKGAIGNPSAAGSMLQITSAILAIRDGVIPHTLNLKNPLPGCDLN